MSYEPQHFTAPDGTEMVVVKAEDFERLRALAGESADAAEALAIQARIAVGEGTMPAEVLNLILDEGTAPLAAWRRYRGLSQAELARRTGLSQVWISRIEAGGGYGSRDTRRRLAAALDAPVWALEEDGEAVKAAKPTRRGDGSDPGPRRKVTAEEIARHYGLNPKTYRAALREERLAWHGKHQRWMVEADSREEAQLISVARKLRPRGRST